MKQRVTYLLPAGTGLLPSDIKIRDDGVDFSGADRASEEWQIKLQLHELPDELRTILEDCNELHLRWSSPQPYALSTPLVSRLPPGLHAFITPREVVDDVQICSLIHRISGSNEAKCASVHDSFTLTSDFSERSAQNLMLQWHSFSPLDSRKLGDTILGKICRPDPLNESWIHTCDALIQDMDHASYIDIDFDARGDALTFTAHWPAHASSKKYRKNGAEDRLEVGVLQAETPRKPEELTLGGYLVVVGDDRRPSSTYFSFPSRHHSLPSNSAVTFTSHFQHPTGLHPKLQITLPSQHLQPPQESCNLHTYLTLPSTLFLDRFQLSDPIFLASQNLITLHILAGADDLEAPEWVTTQWGSASLLQLAIPRDAVSARSEDWTVTIPLHLRYIDQPRKPTDARSEATVEVPSPVVFWACDVGDDVKLFNNPFDRMTLGYDALFGPNTTFYHVPPATTNESRGIIEEIKVPILNADNAEMVQMGTLLAVVVGFAWVCWKLSVAVIRSGRKGGKGKKAL